MTEILLVDDEPQILRIMKVGLEARGFMVRTASSGEKALETIEQRMPDVILLDLQLPGINGLEVCRTIRQFSQVPIIMHSVETSEPDKVRALNDGADDYIVKPCGMDEVIARIHAILRRKSPPAENDSSAL